MRKSARFLTTALALVLLVTSMGITAFAAGPIQEYDSCVQGDLYLDRNGKRVASNYFDPANGPLFIDTKHVSDKDVIIKASDYQELLYHNGCFYDRLGLGFNIAMDGKLVTSGLSNQLKLPGNLGLLDPADQYLYISLVYAPHIHVLDPNAPWVSDDNCHWKVCYHCGGFALQTYHHDIDNDGICDFCNHPIVYRNVTVKDVPGGKITLSADKGTVSNRIAITVTPDDGYRLQEIHGVSTNGKNWIRPCFEDVKGSQYHMILDVFDVEIQPTFVKQ